MWFILRQSAAPLVLLTNIYIFLQVTTALQNGTNSQTSKDEFPLSEATSTHEDTPNPNTPYNDRATQTLPELDRHALDNRGNSKLTGKTSLTTTTAPSTQTHDNRDMNTIPQDKASVTRKNSANTIPQMPQALTHKLKDHLQMVAKNTNKTKNREDEEDLGDISPVRKDKTNETPEPGQASMVLKRNVQSKNDTKQETACDCQQGKDAAPLEMQNDKPEIQSKNFPKVEIRPSFVNNIDRPHELVPAHHMLDNDTFFSLNITLRNEGDAVTVEWQYASNANSITGFVVCYRISKRENYDSSKLGLQVRSFTLHNLHKDDIYDICVHVMIDTTVVREACATWSEDSNKIVVGILAGILFLIPCAIALSCLIYKDNRMKKRYEGLIRQNHSSDVFVPAEHPKETELEEGTYKQRQKQHQNGKSDINTSHQETSIANKNLYLKHSDNDVKDTDPMALIRKPLESSCKCSVNTTDEQNTETCCASYLEDVDVKTNGV